MWFPKRNGAGHRSTSMHQRRRKDCLSVNGPELSRVPSGYQLAWSLRQRASHEHRSVIAAAAWAHQEDHVLAALHLHFNAMEVGFTVDRLLIDFQDYIPAAQTGGFAKAVRLYVLHHDALGIREVEAVGHVLGNAAN